MLSKPAYRVFISSTAQDLVNIRQRVAYEILRAGHIPLSMESWPSSTTKTLDVIRDEIKSCDILVSVQGARYGSLIEGSEIENKRLSYTEFEFDYAVALGRPTLAFLLRDQEFQQERSQFSNGDSERTCDELIAKFREKLKQTRAGEPRIVSHFNNQEDLLLAFVHSLNALIRSSVFQSPGLVPADTLSSQSLLQELEATPFLQPVLKQLKGYRLLFSRVQEKERLKRQLATFFWRYCFPGINEAKAYRLFFESGSTIAYVADGFLGQMVVNRSWEDYLSKVRITTNNILVFLQFLFTSPTLTAELRPQGRPDEKYGATYGIIDKLVSHEPPNDEPLDSDATSIVESMAKYLKAPPTLVAKQELLTKDLLILASASGVTCSGAHIGPHVGSYRNKIFKRALLLTRCPIIFFVDESKFVDLGKAYNEAKCYSICGQQLSWDKVCTEQPVAFCVSVSTTENRFRVAQDLHSIGLTMSSSCEPRGDFEGCLPFLVANTKFAKKFPKIPLQPIAKTGLLQKNRS